MNPSNLSPDSPETEMTADLRMRCSCGEILPPVSAPAHVCRSFPIDWDKEGRKAHEAIRQSEQGIDRSIIIGPKHSPPLPSDSETEMKQKWCIVLLNDAEVEWAEDKGSVYIDRLIPVSIINDTNPPSARDNVQPHAPLREALDALNPWLLHERRCGAEAGDESKCDCGINAALAAIEQLFREQSAEIERLVPIIELLAEQVASLKEENERLRKASIVPGNWRCPKCEYWEIKHIINPDTGASGANPSPALPCPNDGEFMVPLTWKEHALDVRKLCDRYIDERLTPEEAAGILDFHDTGNDFNPNYQAAIKRLRSLSTESPRLSSQEPNKT